MIVPRIEDAIRPAQPKWRERVFVKEHSDAQIAAYLTKWAKSARHRRRGNRVRNTIYYLRLDSSRICVGKNGEFTCLKRADENGLKWYARKTPVAAYLGPHRIGWETWVRRARDAGEQEKILTALERVESISTDEETGKIDLGFPRFVRDYWAALAECRRNKTQYTGPRPYYDKGKWFEGDTE